MKKTPEKGIPLIETAINVIRDRSMPNGGFSLSGGSFRPDGTAWAILALEAAGGHRDLTIPACRRLAQIQFADGHISVVEEHSESFWPTSLAVLAWKKIPGFETELKRGVDFILSHSGRHYPRKKGSVFGHDTSIRGWPWIENTHSWIEPTAMAVLALRVCGYNKYARVLEAVEMILDRQLPSGGWNYGNTTVFGQELLPIPECTGHALCALSGYTNQKCVALSIKYLDGQIIKIRTPLSLSWSIFGLTAWNGPSSDFRAWIIECLALQKKYGSYDTSLLSQLMVAYFTQGNFFSLFDGANHE